MRYGLIVLSLVACEGTTVDSDALQVPCDSVDWFVDADLDGFGSMADTISACEAPVGYVAQQGDCDDSNDAIHPNAVEVCDDAQVDEDCNGTADDQDDAIDLASQTAYYADSDKDGFGDPATEQRQCAPHDTLITDATDCDDTDASVFPGAPEFCDDVQTNCSNTDWTHDVDLVTWEPRDGALVDLSATFAAGTPDAPITHDIAEVGTLHVCDGTWYAGLSIIEQASVVGHGDNVVLHGADQQRLLTIEGEDIAVTVRGLTLTHGYSDGYGGALYAGTLGELTLADLRITDSVSDTYGGGAMVYAQRLVTLNDVTLQGNSAPFGGGFMTYSVQSLVGTDVHIRDNSAETDAGGWYEYDSVIHVTDLVLEGNTSTLWAAGAVFQSSDTTIEGGEVAQNKGARSGGGLVAWKSTMAVSDVTFEGNVASQGAAVYTVYDESITTLTDCTIRGNTSAQDGGAAEVREGRMHIASTSFTDNAPTDVYAGEAYQASDLEPAYTCTTEGCK